MIVTFLNVTISVEADDATEAYNKLCNALSNEPKLEYITDRFITDTNDNFDEQERSTTELMPL